ncbi:MAG: cupin domain-containing protein [Dehalococcoidia bacterium]|nr:MAG: cupin domain-containing protein [Dehalococcoidia bacterium]
MSESEPVIGRTAAERTVVGPTVEGMVREQAFATDGLWSGLARTEPGMDSGWHHHGEYESVIFVVSGTLRMESGPGGSSVFEAGPGDFLYVPRGAVHRELNTGTEASRIVVTRAGHGPPTTNVDGPAPA